ncbi:ABC transporter ATP-binding protein [Sulfitobacter albidus]|uniref:ABC transporter ATP-binding protein n=1 Tax=Sulfitobacter albidus TaxID=2829501 RepID=A0A975PMI5_9RHOB|nr:ATP-binding cassette domain-containing protein [Sulfitobacter albidus]QUJ76759.1 ABC transporter ATP-binding protein [Sulfitobacter albidus]
MTTTLTINSLNRAGRMLLADISLTIAAGETVALTGPSGIGKTTLLRCLAGLETDFDGTRRVPGPISAVFQEPALLSWRNLRDNITVPTRVDVSTAEAALSEVGLAGRGADFPGQLSLGQRRRVALARAFARPPALLLLDEPFVSLDPATAEEMMALFTGLRDRHRPATLLVTHEPREARALADRVLTLEGDPAVLKG